MEWIDPRYAELVACYRQQQVAPEPGLEVWGVPVRWADGEVVARLGFVMEPVPGD
ncbi:hypothetical protein [Kitasatospora brasiliensis]|uniref:hypothetical protein n=1 Tax=Kitasatospora brasiliensis TaxID=3058040 RepID=UPI0029306B73|nr:hypothetical protein [Kitasatospora sp. K002]